MIVSVSGYGFSGASGFVDLLKEYKEVQIVNRQFEFQIIKAPDGLMDLYHFLVERNDSLSSNVAIKRFVNMLKNNNYFSPNKKNRKQFKKAAFEFINKLEIIIWKGESSFDPPDVKTIFQKSPFLLVHKVCRKIFHKSFKIFSSKRYYSNVDSQTFVELADEYICTLIKLLGYDENGLIVFDQLFDACDPRRSTVFLKKWKMIVVDRDPRDVYLLSNFYYGSNASFMPQNCGVDKFIRYYLSTRKNKCIDDRILYFNFEDLLFDYTNVVHKIEKWLDIKNHFCPKKHFNPEKSVANVGLFIKNKAHCEDVEIIQNRLGVFCYNFSKSNVNHILANINTKTFI